jgi:hypothetical protein
MAEASASSKRTSKRSTRSPRKASARTTAASKKRVSRTTGSSRQTKSELVDGVDDDQLEKDQDEKMETRSESVRTIEQLGVLGLSIVLGIFGFLFHPLWIGSLVLSAMLWGFVASGVNGSKRGGGTISEIVTTVVDETREVVKDVVDKSSD